MEPFTLIGPVFSLVNFINERLGKKNDGHVEELLQTLRTQQQLNAQTLELLAAHVRTASDQLHAADSQASGSRASLFSRSGTQVRDTIAELSLHGRRPVLVTAPFASGAPGDGGLPRFPFAVADEVRRLNPADEWSTPGLAVATNLLSRPLYRPEQDTAVIHEVLRDHPVMVLHGQVSEGRRVRVTMSNWNLLDSDPHRRIDVMLGNWDTGEMFQGQPGQLEVEDVVGRMCAVPVMAWADWFHVLRGGPRPAAHMLAPADEPEARRALAAATADLYAQAVDRHRLPAWEGGVRAAEVLAEGGADTAARAAREAFAEVRRAGEESVQLTQRRRLLQRLCAVARDSGDVALEREISAELTKVNSEILHRIF